MAVLRKVLLFSMYLISIGEFKECSIIYLWCIEIFSNFLLSVLCFDLESLDLPLHWQELLSSEMSAWNFTNHPWAEFCSIFHIFPSVHSALFSPPALQSGDHEISSGPRGGPRANRDVIKESFVSPSSGFGHHLPLWEIQRSFLGRDGVFSGYRPLESE